MTVTIVPACPKCAVKMSFDERRNILTCPACGTRKAARSWHSEQGGVLNVVIARRGPEKRYPRRISARVTDEQGAVFDRIGQVGLRRLLDIAGGL